MITHLEEIITEPDLNRKLPVKQPEEPDACQYFFDDNEVRKGRHRVLNFKLSNLSPNKINKNSSK